MKDHVILEMREISKTFPSAKVLTDISMSIRAGEVRALMGENGAGKSTLIKILGGIYTKDEGAGVIRINGEDAQIHSVEDAKRYGVSIIHQELCLAENMTVAENIFMNCEPVGLGGAFVQYREMNREAKKLLEEMELEISPTDIVGNLSIAQQQMVEICRSLSANAKIIVMDEPTSSLTKSEIEQLFVQIEKLKKADIAVIYISHRMDEIYRIADSVTILRDGHLIGTRKCEELSPDGMIAMMVGRELSEIYQHEKPKVGEVFLSVKGLCNQNLKNISFELHQGEVLGFSGLVGSGRTELARAIFGIDQIDAGTVSVQGKEVHIKHPAEAIACGIGLVPEDRKMQGLHLEKSIRYNMTLAILNRFFHLVGYDKRREDSLINEYTKVLSIKMSSTEQEARFLSGGNQQKVVLSKWLATSPKILILDEPTRGIDVGAKAEIYQLIYKIASSGVAVLLISSEMEEIINLSTRIAVMYEGTLQKIFNEEETSRVTQEEIMLQASGGKVYG